MASALKEAAQQATSVVGSLGGLEAMAGPALRDAGGLAGDLLADRRARKDFHKAREVNALVLLTMSFYRLLLLVIFHRDCFSSWM